MRVCQPDEIVLLCCNLVFFLLLSGVQESHFLFFKKDTQQIIDGIYQIPNGTNEYAVDFIALLKIPNLIRNRKQISVIVTRNKNKEAWEKMKEHTAGVYGNIGFNHYKTCSQAEDLNDIDTFFSNVLLEIEIALEEWKTITDLQMLKQIGIHNKMICVQFYLTQNST